MYRGGRWDHPPGSIPWLLFAIPPLATPPSLFVRSFVRPCPFVPVRPFPSLAILCHLAAARVPGIRHRASTPTPIHPSVHPSVRPSARTSARPLPPSPWLRSLVPLATLYPSIHPSSHSSQSRRRSRSRYVGPYVQSRAEPVCIGRQFRRVSSQSVYIVRQTSRRLAADC